MSTNVYAHKTIGLYELTILAILKNRSKIGNYKETHMQWSLDQFKKKNTQNQLKLFYGHYFNSLASKKYSSLLVIYIYYVLLL